jgi:hypothetical protein
VLPDPAKFQQKGSNISTDLIAYKAGRDLTLNTLKKLFCSKTSTDFSTEAIIKYFSMALK